MTRFTPDPDLAGILPAYLDLRRREGARLLAAAALGDLETARLVGHRMKGTGSSYGLPEITRLGQDIEAAALAGETARVLALAQEAAAFVDGLEVVWEASTREDAP